MGDGKANMGDTMGMSGKNARVGGPDLGRQFGAELSARELNARQHNVPASQPTDPNQRRDRMTAAATAGDPMPYYYNNYDGLPVPYAAPSEQKENFMLRSAVRDAAAAEVQKRADANKPPGLLRVDPITDEEVSYLKSMKDQAELAKFDDYVESFIDPRMPGNMKWLMEIYPDYVNRRLQQAHTDYEFALRNQMIDSWGINTFDDLHFKYMVDQGKILGPSLKQPVQAIDSTYTPGWLSPYNFQSPRKTRGRMYFPFASAQSGRKPDNARNWSMDRAGRPLGRGNTEQELARGMYDQDGDPANFEDRMATGSGAQRQANPPHAQNFAAGGGFFGGHP